jgi:Concanavalin A-like lectin/glucanases superfamily
MPRLFAAVAAALVTATLASPAAGATGIVGHWPLNDGAGTTVTDVSGFANDGVLSGDATWVSGLFGGGLSFGGQNGQVRVTDAPSLEPTTAVTVSAWVRHAGSPGPFRYIVAKGATGCIAASYGLYTGPDGGLQFYVSQDAGSAYERSAAAGMGVWDGDWHLVVGSFDGSVLRLYVDGVQVGPAVSYPGSLVYRLPYSNDLYIGNYPGCAQRSFMGLIDDVTIWDRALSAAEVSALEPAAGAGPPSPGPSGALGGNAGSAPGGGSAPGVNAPGPSGSGPVALLTHLWWTQTTLTLGAGGRHRGVMITYLDHSASRVTLTLVRLQAGTKLRGRCVALRRRAGHRCTRQVVVGSYRHTDGPGRTTLHFTGLPGRRLTPGRYRLILTPRSHGTTGRTVVVAFAVRRG